MSIWTPPFDGQTDDMPALQKAVLESLMSKASAGLPFPIGARDAPQPAFEVICAWPVSGQYGPGSRILYYVLVAICVVARKADWLRGACLAAALLFPVVAAIHGIVLAALHVEDAVDMDIFGAFQLLAIGILVAPITARLSRTYFRDPGRNAIILWSTMVIAGLISLTVEFYRVADLSFPCTHDDNGNPLDASSPFPYGSAQCGRRCTPENGPISPIRGGSADNIYIIPVPYVLTFNAGILLTAACCIPGMLLIAWMVVTIYQTSWAVRWGGKSSLKLKVPVVLYDSGTAMTTFGALREHHPSTMKMGFVGTGMSKSSANISPAALSSEHVEHIVETRPSSTASLERSGIGKVIHDLHRKATLSRYEFVVDGHILQLLESNLDGESKDIARELYTAVRELEGEEVELICVERISIHDNPYSEKIMEWLSKESQTNFDGTRPLEKSRRSPGDLILLFVFSAAVLAILVIGERNLFSTPVNYQTEPMANIGQWSPIAGTAFVVAGSIYVLLAEAMRDQRRRMRAQGDNHDNSDVPYLARIRNKFIMKLIEFSDLFDPSQDLFDYSDIQEGKQKYPTTPGEHDRVADLSRTISNYVPQRDSSDSLASAVSGRPSYAPSVTSGVVRERTNTDPHATPPVRRETLEPPELPSPVHRPRRSTQNSMPGSPLEPSVTFPDSPGAPVIVVSPEDHT